MQFPALYFLDNEIFNEAKMTIPKPTPPVPDDIYAILGDIQNIEATATRYFATVHTWLPCISKKRLELALADTSSDLAPELVLLLLTMHIITNEHPTSNIDAQSKAYWRAKCLYNSLEAYAVMAPQLIQANVLIAAYEIGHAIYPAAYLTIGRCVSLAKVLGIENQRGPRMIKKMGAWTENEELRRTWWAIMLLDRSVIT